MTLDDDIALLRDVEIFGDLSTDQLRLIAFGSERRRLAAGQVLFKEGTPADSAFVVRSGRLELTQTTRKGRERIGEAGRAALLGELAMISAVKRSMTATALEPCELIRINRSLFHRMLEEYPEIAAMIQDRLTRNLDALIHGAGRLVPRFS